MHTYIDRRILSAFFLLNFHKYGVADYNFKTIDILIIGGCCILFKFHSDWYSYKFILIRIQ